MPDSCRTWSDAELAAAVNAGGAAAWDELMRRYRRAVCKEAAKWLWCGLSMEELEAEAWIGFMDGVRTYDARRGTALWTNCAPRMRGELSAAACSHLGISDYQLRRQRLIRRAEDALLVQGITQPSPQQILEQLAALGLDQKQCRPTNVKQVQEALALADRFKIEMIADDGSGEDEEEERGAIVAEPGPGPEEQATTREAYPTVVRTLGPEHAPRWLVLFVLRETGDLGNMTWELIAAALRDPTALLLVELWPDRHAELHLPACVPDTWDEVCALFPPPPATAGALSHYYSHGRNALIPVLR